MSGRRSATAREARSDDSVSAIREHTFRRTLLRWGSSSNLRVYPWRQTRDPYELLIAEVMLARTRPADRKFKLRFPWVR
jgi:A/G-specific adenine glycosylase